MEQEKLQPIDLEVLEALFKRTYLPKTADEIARKLNIDYDGEIIKRFKKFLNANNI
ncbi:hypothetical protein [Helicobacter pylori]|uniref:Uncharacterized protein n=1 Tax=Helicobacter pylori NQ4044 TaxID=992028 RepID=J0JIE9_HELPX|nr:hypothetical protein HPNQ4044_0307 [Helicobacter pylori NQ4044]